ncbi:MAG TPA: FHA domain-containing protein [Anaerolineae bacterium]|nr:FHA domain-containing protein [Anaerolineae bacterium]
MSQKRFLIIGDGAAGTTAAQYLRFNDPNAHIEIIADDPNAAYFRAALTNYLIGELREDQIWAVPPTFYNDYNIIRTLARVTHVDLQQKQLYLSQGGPPKKYDKLLIAAGASARQPPFTGASLAGVMVMRTLQDVRTVMDQIRVHGLKEAVIIGGGPLGLEWAQGLRERGIKVTYLLRGDRLMSRAIDKTASDLTLARMRLAGVEIHTHTEIEEAIPGPNGQVVAVRTKKGDQIPCQLVGVAIGVVCNSQFLQGSGLNIDKRGALITDDQMRTNIPDVYAAGDIAVVNNFLPQLWEPARHQGRVAAYGMIGKERHYRPGAHYNATRLFDLDLGTVGQVINVDGAQELIDFPQDSQRISYRKLLVKNGRLVGAQLLGLRQERVRLRGRDYKKLIDAQVDISSLTQAAEGQLPPLLDSSFDLKGWLNTNVVIHKPQVTRTLAKLSAADIAKAASGELIIANSAQMRGQMNLQRQTASTSAQPVVSNPQFVPQQQSGGQQLGSVGLSTMQLTPPNLATGAAAFLTSNEHIWPLEEAIVSLGRDDNNTIPLNDTAASHLHAQITRHGHDLYLRDVGSRNGTWVNGSQVVVPHKLQNNDQIQIGRTTLTFTTDAEPTTTPAQPAATETPPQPPRLVVRSGNQLGLTFQLPHDQNHIGRNPDTDVHLDDLSVSWQHASLNFVNGRWQLTDLGSTNGTQYNDQRLAANQTVTLTDDTEIIFGRVTLRFYQGDKSATSAPPPTPTITSPSTPPKPTTPPSTSPTTESTCVHCGNPVNPAAKFCPHCGQPPQATTPAPTIDAALPQPGEIPCPHCWKPIKPDIKFCPHCGQSPHNAPATPPPVDITAVAPIIVIPQPDGKPTLFPLDADNILIGRHAETCQIHLTDTTVSGQHALIRQQEDGYYIQDRGSTHGTFINNTLIGEEPVRLKAGDKIRLGPNVTLEFKQ